MELSALVGTPAASNVPAEVGTGMSGVTGEELFDPLDLLREVFEPEASQPTSTTTPSSYKRQRHNIAAANPLLAGNSLFSSSPFFFLFCFFLYKLNISNAPCYEEPYSDVLFFQRN